MRFSLVTASYKLLSFQIVPRVDSQFIRVLRRKGSKRTLHNEDREEHEGKKVTISVSESCVRLSLRIFSV